MEVKGQTSQEEGDEEASPPHFSHCEEHIGYDRPSSFPISYKTIGAEESI